MFVIKGLTYYPNSNIIFFNRWGNEVFKANSYQNNWDGTSNRGITIGGDVLPVGTYFYILDLGVEGKAPIKGYVYLNK